MDHPLQFAAPAGLSAQSSRNWKRAWLWQLVSLGVLNWGWAVVASTILLSAPCRGASPIDFGRDIRPILSQFCFPCHGPDSSHREADLRLDLRQRLLEVVTSGDAASSPLFARVTSADPAERMPPSDLGKELSPQQIELLREWIGQGAVWVEHWAYRKPVPHAASRFQWESALGRKLESEEEHWIDRFIEGRLTQQGMKPSPRADRVTLARRLAFDLWGLPPRASEVEAFVADRRPDAYLRYVDRLLESPAFSERMSMYWLDLVRYADTVGYHGDQDQNISPYRDYVIEAFRRDLPFDQFTREQLAGDLLPDPTLDQRIATGYNRLLQTTHEGGLQPSEYRAIYAADRVRNISAVWLGGTLGCAQCHDHKFDPYTLRDFYAMSSFFSDIDDEEHFKTGTNELPTKRPPEIDVLPADAREAWHKLERAISAAEKAAPVDVTLLENLKRERQTLENRRQRTMITVALSTPRTVRILPRGNWLDTTGPEVAPAIPEFLGHLKTESSRATRLDLANWLVDTEHGIGLLTARVWANRLWYLFMGQGLCESVDDFGAQGKVPNHPELLDNLAIDLAKDWSIRRFVKQLVLTRTYQQESVASPEIYAEDPLNLFFARQSRYRLSAEMVRDTALAVSGLLVEQVGGPSVRPYQPAEYYRHLNFPKRRYAHHADARQWRRGLYVHWQRQYLHPMLKAFDAPTREECTAQRPRSNTPLASLVLLNDPTFVEAARGMAERLIMEVGCASDRGAIDDSVDRVRIELAFRWALSRIPDEVERKIAEEVLVGARQTYRRDPEGAIRLLGVGEAERRVAVGEPVELAAWTSVCRLILNLGETYMRR